MNLDEVTYLFINFLAGLGWTRELDAPWKIRLNDHALDS